MTLKEIFTALLGLGFDIPSALAMVNGQQPADVTAAPSQPTAAMNVANVVDDEPEPSRQRRRRRRTFAPRVRYQLTKAGQRVAGDKAKMAKIKDILFPTTFATFVAIVKAGEPVHIKVIEAETGLKPKTVESDVYKLRKTVPALIESIAVE